MILLPVTALNRLLGRTMKPPPFRYHASISIAAVAEIVGADDYASQVGGQSRVPILNVRYALPNRLIDLNHVNELRCIRVSIDVGSISCMTHRRDVEFSEVIVGCPPGMPETISLIGHRQTRNRGIIGGSISVIDPSAEWGLLLSTPICA